MAKLNFNLYIWSLVALKHDVGLKFVPAEYTFTCSSITFKRLFVTSEIA